MKLSPRNFRLFILSLTFSLISSFAIAEEADIQPVQKPVDLLAKGLDGWIWYTKNDKAKKQNVWSLSDDGVLSCKGRPGGYIQTKMWYRDYVLDLDWRWTGKKGGNSGVLVHASAPMVLGVWPRSLEVQLGSGDAGDFWNIGRQVDIQVPNLDKRRTSRRTRNLTDDSEKKIGEWNHMKVICKKDTITVFVNGVEVNAGTKCTLHEGAICLQSEGTPVEFRSVILSPLPTKP